MKNTVYMIKTEVRKGTWYKVGFTSNLYARLIPYSTHNPAYELVSMVEVYSKTKRALESNIHNEIEKMGYNFKMVNGVKTEWFFVDKEHEHEFDTKGLKMFKSCKNRTVYYI